MSRTTFRNRRGHSVSVRQAIEEIEQSPSDQRTKRDDDGASWVKKATKKTQTKEQKKPKESSAPKPNRSKKKILIAVIATVLLALLTGLLISDSSKRAYESQKAAMQRKVTSLTDSPYGGETSTVEVSQQLQEGLKQPADCSVAIDASTWYPPAASSKQSCLETAADYSSLRDALTEFEAVAEYYSSVQKSLGSPLTNPRSGDFANVSEYAELWSEATKSLSRISPPQRMNKAHTKLEAATVDVLKSWEALRQAHIDQDRTAFEASEKRLTDAYAAIREVSHDLSAESVALQEDIDRLAAKLFRESL